MHDLSEAYGVMQCALKARAPVGGRVGAAGRDCIFSLYIMCSCRLDSMYILLVQVLFCYHVVALEAAGAPLNGPQQILSPKKPGVGAEFDMGSDSAPFRGSRCTGEKDINGQSNNMAVMPGRPARNRRASLEPNTWSKGRCEVSKEPGICPQKDGRIS